MATVTETKEVTTDIRRVKETVTIERKYEKSGPMHDMVATVVRTDGEVGNIGLTAHGSGGGVWYLRLSSLDELAVLRDLIDEVLEGEK
jgi:hypothetical protein